VSALSEHVDRELARTDLDETTKVNIRLITSLYDAYGYYGKTKSNIKEMIYDLVRFKSLTPITDDPAEWDEVAPGIWKNNRRSDTFSLNGGTTYYYARNGTCSTNPWPQHVSYPHNLEETND